MRERSEWSGGANDIEGKATRVGASECGQRTSFNRPREAGNRDEVEGAVANTLKLHRNGAAKPRALCFTLVGFIDWLDDIAMSRPKASHLLALCACKQRESCLRARMDAEA